MKRSFLLIVTILLVAAGCDNKVPQNSVTQNGASAEPLGYRNNPSLFVASKTAFSLENKFSANTLAAQSEECGTRHSVSYYNDLLTRFGPVQGTEYQFKYKGQSQDSGTYIVTVIPNEVGYADLKSFQDDFNICAVGGNMYPSLISQNYLLFKSGVNSGFDDESGLPFGSEEIQKFIDPTLKLE